MATSSQGSSPTRLLLIRHGESEVTVDRVIGGFRTCRGLSPLGRRQVEQLRDRLLATGEAAGGVLISSNFARAVETARIIAPAIAGADADADIVIDAGFGEHDPGPDLDGMSFERYVDRFGAPDWTGDPHHDVFPGGETIAEFHMRVGATLSSAVTQHAGRLIVVSCHGGVVDAVFRRLLDTAPTGVFDLWTLNASLTEFQLPPPADGDDRRWRLVRYNDAAHLTGLPRATRRVPVDRP